MSKFVDLWTRNVSRSWVFCFPHDFYHHRKSTLQFLTFYNINMPQIWYLLLLVIDSLPDPRNPTAQISWIIYYQLFPLSGQNTDNHVQLSGLRPSSPIVLFTLKIYFCQSANRMHLNKYIDTSFCAMYVNISINWCVIFDINPFGIDEWLIFKLLQYSKCVLFLHWICAFYAVLSFHSVPSAAHRSTYQ